MVFGLTQWFVSFLIFLIVLSVIIWSAVHLSKKEYKKEKRYTNITVITAIYMPQIISPKYEFNQHNQYYQYFYPYYPPYPRSSKELELSLPKIEKSETGNLNIYANITLPQVSQQTTTISSGFAYEQGTEVLNTSDFFSIMKALSSAKSAISNMTINNNTSKMFVTTIVNNDTTTVVANGTTAIDNDTNINDETWNTNTVYSSTDKPVTLNNRGNEITKPSNTSQMPQIIHSPTIRKFFDLDRLPQSSPYRSVGLELSDFLQNERNETLNASMSFSFVRALSSTKLPLNATRTTYDKRAVSDLLTQ